MIYRYFSHHRCRQAWVFASLEAASSCDLQTQPWDHPGVDKCGARAQNQVQVNLVNPHWLKLEGQGPARSFPRLKRNLKRKSPSAIVVWNFSENSAKFSGALNSPDPERRFREDQTVQNQFQRVEVAKTKIHRTFLWKGGSSSPPIVKHSYRLKSEVG